MGRDYDEARDFEIFSNDLVAEYQEVSSPLDTIREDLKAAINTEYSNTYLLHDGIGD